MSAGQIAERYAQAIFELGSEQGELSTLCEQLSAFSAAVDSSPELKGVLTNPLCPVGQRTALIREVAERLGISSLGVRALLVIARRSRITALGAIVERLSLLVDEREGIIRASVVTATEMPESYFQTLTEHLQSATTRRVVLKRSIDPDLIAGAVAKIGDSVLDSSVRGRLRNFERQILLALAAGTA